MGRSGLVEYTGETIDSCIILIGRAEGKGLLARTRHRWEDKFYILKDMMMHTGCVWLRVGTSDELLC
jgi:hypothetical protein